MESTMTSRSQHPFLKFLASIFRFGRVTYFGPIRLETHLLTHITGHKDIWLTTGGEIAEWFYERYYDNALLAAPLPPRPV